MPMKTLINCLGIQGVARYAPTLLRAFSPFERQNTLLPSYFISRATPSAG